MGFDERQLSDFLAVVDHGSLGRAAKAIHTTQPALSRRLRDLEGRLGVRLFDRHAKGMALTSFGEALVPHARLLAFEMGQAIETLDALRGLHRGRLRVGAVAAIARSILPCALDALLRERSGLSVELVEAGNDQLAIALLNNSLDVIVSGQLPEQDGIARIAECSFEDRHLAFCASDHPLCAQEILTLADVVSQSWVLPGKGNPHRTLFEEAMRRLGRPIPHVPIETVSTSAITAIVKQTRYLGWLPHSLFSAEEAAGEVRVLDVADLSVRRRFSVYRRSRGLFPPAASQFVRELAGSGLVDAS